MSLGVATQRAASAREPYSETACFEQLLLVGRGTPAAVDVELDPVRPGIRRGLAERIEESRIKVGHGRILVIEDRHAVRDLPVSGAKRVVPAVLTLVGRLAWDAAVKTLLRGVRGRLRGGG